MKSDPYRMEMTENEIYAGPDAWRDWFERCAVKRCHGKYQQRLVRQITSALTLALSRHGLRPVDFKEEDMGDLFDIHFILKGKKDKPKPLKAYYLARIDKDNDDQLKKLVCGNFFSAKRGLVRDLARAVVPLVKGWAPHKVDGRIVWEAPLEKRFDDEGNEIDVYEQAVLPSFPKDEAKVWTRHVDGILKAIGGKNCLDAPLLVYCIANGIRPFNPTVWKHLKVKSVRANQLFHTALASMALYMKKNGLSFEDVGFMTVLIKKSSNILGSKIVNDLEKSK